MKQMFDAEKKMTDWGCVGINKLCDDVMRNGAKRGGKASHKFVKI